MHKALMFNNNKQKFLFFMINRMNYSTLFSSSSFLSEKSMFFIDLERKSSGTRARPRSFIDLAISIFERDFPGDKVKEDYPLISDFFSEIVELHCLVRRIS